MATASSTLEIAIYDLKLEGAAAEMVRQALQNASSRGVAVRLVFNEEHPRQRPLPPPGFVDYEYLRSLAVPSRAIPGMPDLMHHK